MADINQVITLGVGTPSDIEHFILFGLGVGATESPTVIPWTLRERDTAWSLANRSLAWTLRERDLTWTLAERDLAWSLRDRDITWTVEER